MDWLAEFSSNIKQKKITVGIIGLGYVGLPLAVEFAKKFIEQAIEKRNTQGVAPLGLHLLLGETADIKMRNVFGQVLKGSLAPGLIVAQTP